MKYYMAPLEGITGYIYRRAYHENFEPMDKYFTPFISTHKYKTMNTREIQDVLPENNKGMYTVPQILTNSWEEFIKTAGELKEYGYTEINLNLGCPSGTVTAKKKGAGFLEDPEILEQFLDKIFDKTDMKISIKTRLGIQDGEEFEEILAVYNKYPLEELVIHPRVKKDMYKNTPDWDRFQISLGQTQHKICYNGDIFTGEDYKKFIGRFPQVECIMLGRGILANPGLPAWLRTQTENSKDIMRRFHDRIYGDYQEVSCGEKNVLFKMKEFWSYFQYSFSDQGKLIKKIRKSQRLREYEAAVNRVFAEEELLCCETLGFSKK